MIIMLLEILLKKGDISIIVRDGNLTVVRSQPWSSEGCFVFLSELLEEFLHPAPEKSHIYMRQHRASGIPYPMGWQHSDMHVTRL